VNDELIISDEDNEFFKYKPGNTDSQRVQETLFHEKQTIIENCLFGVDINPNSVKICRLRLWIELLKNAYYKAETNYTELETLPNIDINIKCGNSLVSRFDIEADLKQIAKSAKWNIFSYQNAVESYKRSPEKENKHELEKLIRNIKLNYVETIQRRHPRLQKYYRLKQEYDYRFPENGLFAQEPEEIYGANSAKLEEEKKRLSAEIEKLQAEIEAEKGFLDKHKAFEWRIEFPEVLNEDGDFTRFDVVIGNPPYIRQEELGDLKTYLRENYQVYAGTADLLVYFFERGLDILREKGHFCMITSNKFMKANYGKSLRRYLAERQMTDIVDFGELPVFDEAATFPAIFQMSKKKKSGPVRFTQVKTLDFDSLHRVVAKNSVILPDEAFGEDFWSLGDVQVNRILEKMKEVGVPLGEYIEGKIYYGIKTGYNKAFIIDEAKRKELIGLDPKSAEIIFPFAIGDDVRNYHVRQSYRYIILTKIGIDISRYPAVFNHMKTYQKELEARWDKGEHWWQLRACAYYDAFNKPKIVYPDIAKESRFTYVEGPMYFGNTCYFIPSEDKVLLGLLNSRLIWFYYSKMASVLGDPAKGGRLRWFSQDVMKIPIPAYNNRGQKIENLVNKILESKKLDPQADVSEMQAKIDELVCKMYGLRVEERKLIMQV
jgi:adenine-specific DNA-methyltransferase